MTTIQSILDRLTHAVGCTDKEYYTPEERRMFAEYYADKADENTSEDEIAEAFVDYWRWEDAPYYKECRRCSVCGKLMREGYCVDMGFEYYCSDECLHQEFTDEEWEQECEKNDQSYWTIWY